MEPLLTAREVAKKLNIHPKSVYKLAMTGKIPFIKKEGIGLRFRENDLEKCFASDSRKVALVGIDFTRKFEPVVECIDNMPLKGEGTLSKKSSKYWNYKGIGAIYVKGKTKKGGDSWYIWYYDERGKRRQEHVKSSLCREDALSVLLQRADEVRQKRFGNRRGKKGCRFEEFAGIYLNDYAKLRKRSWKSDKKYLTAQLVPFFG